MIFWIFLDSGENQRLHLRPGMFITDFEPANNLLSVLKNMAVKIWIIRSYNSVSFSSFQVTMMLSTHCRAVNPPGSVFLTVKVLSPWQYLYAVAIITFVNLPNQVLGDCLRP